MARAPGVPFRRVRVRLDEPVVADVTSRVDEALESCGVSLVPGTQVAIALGSRGIVDLATVVRRVIDWVRAQGAEPFVVSAMGSHGGATAEGQRAVLASYGLDEQHLGCAVRASMEVVELPVAVGGQPVVFDAEAARATATILVNRVKPHTDFHGTYESGLVKMAAIGLGNRVQAERIHAYGAAGLRALVPEIGAAVLAHANVVLGVAIVENALEQVMAVEAIVTPDIESRELGLIDLARAHMPRLPVDDLDVLLVDQMGKDVSGVGMDTNVIGRMLIRGEADPETPRIRMIGCHRLTEASHGNACGMGLADVVPRAFVEAVDQAATRTNVVTSGFLLRGKLPVVADDDREVWELCLRGAGVVDEGTVRACRIVDTLHCADLWVTDAVHDELRHRDDITVVADGLALHGEDGTLLPFDAAVTEPSIVAVADDRTGAFETAGACADRGHSAAVVPWGAAAPEDVECVVLDLASRHLSAADAAARAVAAPPAALHKIDSTLRGAWAHELVARHRATGRAVLVVPAFPAAGRECVGGVVRVDGVPIGQGAAATDARGPITSSRPADHLRAAGATNVIELDARSLRGWLDATDPPIGVCDASTGADLDDIAATWATHPEVVLAGTAATLAAAVSKGAPPARPDIALPALVVCGSLHPMALAQADAAEAAGVDVVRPRAPVGADPATVAIALAAEAHAAMSSRRPATVVVIGGDTAAALLGAEVVEVGGTVAPGVAWSRPWGDAGALLLTKPGGFGTEATVRDLCTGARS